MGTSARRSSLQCSSSTRWTPTTWAQAQEGQACSAQVLQGGLQRHGHKRKKVKLAVLKFYKVDSNDKVTRLRRECPHELCGPGVFMAMHFNRYYCGKCHLTYLIKKGEDA